MSENKLITLFKQCCDNPAFVKGHKEVRGGMGRFPVDEQPINISDDINAMILAGGYTIKDIGIHYTSAYYGRVFEFDGEPPLKLMEASLKMTLLMDTKYIRLGEVEEDFYIRKREKYIDTFWGKRKKVEYEERYKFLKRSVEHPVGIREANEKIWKENQKSGNAWGFCPRSCHRYDRPKMIIVSQSYKRDDASNWWFQKDVDVMESSHYDGDMHDYDNVLSGIQHDQMEINGGLLWFGDVWLWLDWDDYQALDKCYTDSIKRTHEAILEQRLNETKKG